MEEKKLKPVRICPECRGTGLDKAFHQRYTTGGRDDRACKHCNGECVIEMDEESQREKPS